MTPVPFEIIEDAHGKHGTDGTRVMTLTDPAGRMFKRRAIKGIGTPEARPVEWLVAELDGVRVYLSESGVIVTREDLLP